MRILIALISGTVFGFGLTVSDMANPARVLNFLDFAGRWDPSLMFVMGGGLVVAMVGYRLAFRRAKPLFADRFHVPAASVLDRRLLIGAVLFGIGWGLAGICPGPALTALVTMNASLLLFIAAMVVGMLGARLLGTGRARPPAPE